jgi:hypothetical protein
MTLSISQLTVPAPRSSGRGAVTARELAGLGGALVVYIADRDLDDDDRSGPSSVEADLDGPELARAKLVRAAGWWQLGQHRIDEWIETPALSPRLLVAVTGPVRERRIWASVEIDRDGWDRAERHDQGLYVVPTVPVCCVTVADERIVPVHPIRVTLSSVDAAGLGDRLLVPGEIGALGQEGERWFGPARSQQSVVVAPRS